MKKQLKFVIVCAFFMSISAGQLISLDTKSEVLKKDVTIEQVSKNVDIVAPAEDGWYLFEVSWGCRCEEFPELACDISAQCACSWGGCECCEDET